MIIIGAALCGDYVVIASDSLAFEPEAETKDENTTKLWPIEGASVVWGFFGPQPFGHEFKEWVNVTGKGATSDWSSFRDLAAQKLARWHGDRKRLARIAEAEWNPHEAIAAIFAGYMGGHDRILIIDGGGQSNILDPDQRTTCFLASKEPRAAADAVCRALIRERGQKFALNAEAMRDIIEPVVSTFVSLGGPIQMWKITPAGAQRVQ